MCESLHFNSWVFVGIVYDSVH